MELAMICSNVDSIKDYCNNKDIIFCENNVASCIDTINYLNNKDKISEMKKESLLLSKKLTIEKIYHRFCNL